MLSTTLARRARRGIIARFVLKLGTILAVLLVAVTGWLFPQSALWRQISSPIAVANDAVKQFVGKDRPSAESKREVTDLDRLKFVNGFAPAELRCLVMAIYYEAGREPREAQIGVAQVALNRAAAAKTPKLVCKVVYNGVGTPGACLFGTTCSNVGVTPRQDGALSDAVAVAVEVASGKADAKQFANATHFHETKKPPPWSRGLFTLVNVGKLRFLTTDQPENAADPAPDPNAPAADRASRNASGAVPRRASQRESTATQAPSRDTRELSRQVFGGD